jgi:predicted nucleic acid-binding protein
MILLDTGYFVALFSPGDDLHGRAVAWSLVLREPMLVTEYVLWECVNTFSKPKDRTSAHALIEHVQSDPTSELVAATPGAIPKPDRLRAYLMPLPVCPQNTGNP